MPGEPSCIVCKESRCIEIVAFRSGLDGELYHVMKCEKCGLLFVSPLPNLSPDNLKKIYGEDYAESVFPPSEDKLLEAALGRQMDIVEHYGKIGDVLNVGAMSGECRILKERGWKLQMVEASAYAAERARERWGFDITVSRIEDFSPPPESFDFVKLGHVIEHLGDPSATLDHLHRMLRVGGLILIDTDNAEGLETRVEASLIGVMQRPWVRRLAESLVGKKYRLRYGRLTPPVHLYTFTLKSLTSLVSKRGFEVVKTFNASWGDPTWWPLTTKTLLEIAFRQIDRLGGKFGRGNVIAVLARKV